MAEALIDGRCTDGPYPLFEYEWVFVNRKAEGTKRFLLVSNSIWYFVIT